MAAGPDDCWMSWMLDGLKMVTTAAGSAVS
jgi:hypothetical protein